MKRIKFYQQPDFQNILANQPDIREHIAFENAIISRHIDEESFFLDGYCKVCDSPTTFLVDKLYGSQETDDGWIPNWRERLVCTHCQLNNRQRAMLHAIKEAIATRTHQKQTVSLYAMEQITPLFSWLSRHFDNVIGSEYLGDNIEGGTLVDGFIKGIRHENVEALTFADENFDIITSNDVLEHVNLPEQAIAESYRILKPNGEIFLSIPFFLYSTKTVRRAQLINGQLEHLLPQLYHGNPLSKEGSLVFHDFGWDLLAQMKTAGFQKVALCHYWSYIYGYLGEPQYYFWARK